MLDRLAREFEALAPDSVAALRDLVKALEDHGVPPDRIELDLGFGRGIGFYSQVVFELVAATPVGPVEVCGGGRYDGLARVFGSDRDDRGAGFAFGLERLLSVLQAQGFWKAPNEGTWFLVVAASASQVREAVQAAARIRSAGWRAILEADPERFKAGRNALPIGTRAIVLGPAGEDSLLLDRDRVGGEWAGKRLEGGLAGIERLLEEMEP